ncbi:hypothetical protein GCM10011496_19090 [Polaromonas eurypsychrophila]|uniref:Uncharacterized protein n=1 Tax=Polaromonas eurypsychrophila TaxID=1614635 RepID=A0A916WGU7_9BURK|nr:hypothetical protein GCM10011496_19090 [Polaromonas eurypsychrophila]
MAAVISTRLPDTGKDSGKSIFKGTDKGDDKTWGFRGYGGTEVPGWELPIIGADKRPASRRDEMPAQEAWGAGNSTASPLAWSNQATRLA